MKKYLEHAYLETGIRNINKLAELYKDKGVEIYFHMDLDGVTSGIAIKEYLKRYGINPIAAHIMQYGEKEYSVTKKSEDSLKALVDFANGKIMMNIHTDHHDRQTGVEAGTSTSFVKAPANAAYLSQTLSPSDIFPQEDINMIATVDSADFARQGFTVDDVVQTIFNPVLEKGQVLKNKQNLGFVVNKLLLAFKNKPEFLETVVLKSNPSLLSMYYTIKGIMQEKRYASPEELKKKGEDYFAKQAGKVMEADVNNIINMKSGDHMIFDNVAVQFGGGYMVKGGYDRYTIFKNNPDIDFYVIGWDMGLVQITKNPFKKDKDPIVEDIDLGELAKTKVLPKLSERLKNVKVSLLDIKYVNEKEVTKKSIEDAIGFNYNDFMAIYKDMKMSGYINDEKVKQAANVKFKDLSDEEKSLLKSIKISLWDIVQKSSGGHKGITNMSGFAFMSYKEIVPTLKELMTIATNELLKLLGKSNGNVAPEAPITSLKGEYVSTKDKDSRFKFGSVAEEMVFNKIKEKGFEVINTKSMEGWNSGKDLREGDLWVKTKTGRTIKIDVKSGRAISLNSLDNFEGDYYMFINSRDDSMTDSFIAPAKAVKSYCNILRKKPENIVTLDSGMEGVRVNLRPDKSDGGMVLKIKSTVDSWLNNNLRIDI